MRVFYLDEITDTASKRPGAGHLSERLMTTNQPPLPDSAGNDQAYSGIDNLEVMVEARRYTDFLRHLIASAGGENARQKVADFGAGTGLFASLWSQRAAQLTCIEPDAELRRRLAARGLVAVDGSAAIADATQDFIYTLNVLEHIADDRAAARELYRMLKPGGRLLVYVPAFPVLYSAMDRKVGHLRRYRREALVKLLREAGFSVDDSAYADSLGFFASLLYRFVGSADGGINMSALILYDRVIFPVSRLLDRLCRKLFGKNVYAVAVKPFA